MSYSRRPKAGLGEHRLINTSIAASGARDVESTEVASNETDEGVHPSLNRAMPNSCSRKPCSWWPDTTVLDQRGAGTGTTDSEMSIADVVDEDCDSDASTVTYPENVASILEWRGRVLHAQEVTQVTSFCQQHTAEERWRGSLEIKIKQIRQHFHEQERILEGEIVKHQQRYEWAIQLLEKEEKDEVDYSVAGWWEVQSDYQPTECGNDGSR